MAAAQKTWVFFNHFISKEKLLEFESEALQADLAGTERESDKAAVPLTSATPAEGVPPLLPTAEHPCPLTSTFSEGLRWPLELSCGDYQSSY